MFGYNPTVQDRSGEITAAGQLQGAQGLAGGITTAASGISGALDKISGLKMQAAQTDATAALAQKMGLFNSANDPDGMNALHMIEATPWNQKINIGPSIVQMAGQQALMSYRNAMLGQGQQRVDQAAATASNKNSPVDLY
jgi:hypothetical protein